ncbi:hypothetical protein Sste5346_006820 [Sporothrix stenoceras]|uniref:Uncharacterized protein n=1 Tax=Sporothrix stenoceras TaxID=5173 RepID=A0ABR3YXV0_9PEZI
MAPRSASRCCRAVRIHLASPSASTTSTTSGAQIDGIWITDLVLASAFAHYCRISALPASTTTTRRFASNVPGPLESRRRLGKRQMTDQLSSQLSLGPGGPLLPAWGLPNTPDLREWTWSPPRSVQELAGQDQNENVVLSRKVQDKSNLGRRRESSASILPAWLTGFGGEPPVAEATSPADSIEPKQRSIAAQLLFTKLQAWNESMPTLSERNFSRQLDDICRELQSHIGLAAMTVDESHEAVGLVWKGLSEKGKESRLAFENNAFKLYAAVLEGIRSCRLLNASDYGTAFWRDLYVYVSQLLPNSSSSISGSSPRVTAMALDTLLATPPQFLAAVADLLPPQLCAVFANQNVATRTGTNAENNAATAASHVLTRAQVQEIAEALEHIDLGQHDNVIDATTELLVAASGISAKNHTTTTVCGWLLTLAHMPSVRQDCLFKAMSQLQSSASQAPVETTQAATTAQTTQTTQTTQAEPVLAATDTELATAHTNHLELCELLLTQWISRGYVTQQVQRSFEQTMAAIDSFPQPVLDDVEKAHNKGDNGNHPGALAALALAVFWPKHSRGQCVALYVSLLKGLHETLGRDAPDVLVASLNALLAHMQAASQSGASNPGLPTFPPNTFYESLAWAADDLETAIHLHDMYASIIDLQTPPPAQPYWNISFWDKFAGQLAAALDAGKLTPGQVCHVLDLLPRSKATAGQQAMRSKSISKSKSKSKATYKPAKELGEDTVTLIEKLAVHFALAPNMAPRRALRGVELCRGILTSNAGRKARLALKESLPLPTTSLSGPLSSESLFSPTVLRALFHLVTRDLDDSMPGRTSRLKWFLAIVARERGIKAATECERALVRWRDAVKKHNKNEGIRIREEERELLEHMKKSEY